MSDLKTAAKSVPSMEVACHGGHYGPRMRIWTAGAAVSPTRVLRSAIVLHGVLNYGNSSIMVRPENVFSLITGTLHRSVVFVRPGTDFPLPKNAWPMKRRSSEAPLTRNKKTDLWVGLYGVQGRSRCGQSLRMCALRVSRSQTSPKGRSLLRSHCSVPGRLVNTLGAGRERNKGVFASACRDEGVPSQTSRVHGISCLKRCSTVGDRKRNLRKGHEVPVSKRETSASRNNGGNAVGLRGVWRLI